jgi:hypothetical protein
MRLYESGAEGMREMEELGKIKYNIGEMLKKKQGDTLAQSLEVKFAERLNQIVTTTAATESSTPSPTEATSNPLMSKLGAFMGRQATQKAD